MEPLSRSTGRNKPLLIARAAGLFYLVQFAFGPAMLALSKVYVPGDAARTASNIVAHDGLFRLGFSANLVAIASYIVVTALLYELFRPVSRTLSFLAACFSLTGCTILASSCIFYYGPVVALEGSAVAGASMAQSQYLALMLLKLYGQGYNTSLVFFGFYCALIGYLIFKSTFMPRALGVGMVLAGIGWLTFLSPSFARSLGPSILLAGAGEAALVIWLLMRGVNSARWHELAAAARLSS